MEAKTKILRTKKNKISSPVALQALLNGIGKLIEGQKQFAQEFGLSLTRVFPQLDKYLQQESMDAIIEQWLSEGESGAENLEQLFIALIRHQLALIAALDGIALRTLQESTQKSRSRKLKQWWKSLWQPLQALHLQELKHNQQLRYQLLITPGFIDAYLRAQQSLAGEQK